MELRFQWVCDAWVVRQALIDARLGQLLRVRNWWPDSPAPGAKFNRADRVPACRRVVPNASLRGRGDALTTK